MKRDQAQRRTYAIHRLGLALKRLNAARGKTAKQQAARWAAAWGGATGVAPPSQAVAVQEARAAAAAWRARWPGHAGGVVLVWSGEGYGWKNCLRDAGHERPGALAVDADGNVYRAEGGNDLDGASVWVVV